MFANVVDDYYILRAAASDELRDICGCVDASVLDSLVRELDDGFDTWSKTQWQTFIEDAKYEAENILEILRDIDLLLDK